MENQFVGVAERAIGELVATFQAKPGRYWNERDLHWILYSNMRKIITEHNALELIRAEFPTINKYPTARGYYDLVILDPISYYSEDVQKISMDADWDEFLPKLSILISIEIKLWQAKLSWKKVDEYIDPDIQKLTDTENKVVHPYFLNFVQLDFEKKDVMKKYYIEFRQHIANLRSQWSNVRTLCVPNKIEIQPASENWLYVS